MSTLTYNGGARDATAAGLPADNQPLYLGVRMTTWVQGGMLGLLFILLFRFNLLRLWDKANPFTGEDNWKHAIFVPLIGLYYLYINREQLRSAPSKITWWGLPVALAGILFFAYGIWPGQNDWFKDIGMVVTLFGIVTLMCGWRVMKIAWFPIAFLVCAIPWPGLFYSWLAGPLQKMAAIFAVRTLNLIGVGAMQSGTKIFISDKHNMVRTLNVAEACAGLRSLMTFVAIAGAVAFLSTFRPLWQKLVIVASAIPIAIACNMMRVTVQGIFDRYVSPEWSESFAHGFLGLAMMIPAFFLILLVGWVLSNIFIDEVDDKQALRAQIGTGTVRRAASLSMAGQRRQPAAPTSGQAAAIVHRSAATSPGPATAGGAALPKNSPNAPMPSRPAPATRPAAAKTGGVQTPSQPATPKAAGPRQAPQQEGNP